MNVEFISSLNQAQKRDLLHLYHGEFWSRNRELADLDAMLQGSSLVYGLTTPDGRLVGFVRVLTDFIFKANIYDLIVDPRYRRRGLGRKLLDRVLTDSRLACVEHMDLHCLANMADFYHKWGFSEKLEPLTAMRRMHRQNRPA